MVHVVSEAQPAELVFTLPAGHVHASLILLYGYLALRAMLSVKLQPYFCAIIAYIYLVVPLRELLTVHWPVSFLQTLEAPIILTTLAYYISLPHRWVFYCIITG